MKTQTLFKSEVVATIANISTIVACQELSIRVSCVTEATIGMTAFVTVLAVGLLGSWFWSRAASTAPFVDAAGKLLPDSIASLERVMLGGVEQGMLIRGSNVDNPVLLYLHGGPGTSELGMVRQHNMPALEKHFTVVVWDQRGAGMSYSARHPESAMTVEQFIADTHELTQLLRQRFGQAKVYLVGHSWGSALGVLTAQRYPDLHHAYVGVGQVVRRDQRLVAPCRRLHSTST